MSLPGQETEEDSRKHPLEETIKAIGRVKDFTQNVAERVDNMEKFMQRAFKDGSKGFEAFMSGLDEKINAQTNGESEVDGEETGDESPSKEENNEERSEETDPTD